MGLFLFSTDMQINGGEFTVFSCSVNHDMDRKGLLTDKQEIFLYDRGVDVGDQVCLHHEDEQM